MLALEFPGCTRMVERLDDAVARDSTVQITDALRRTLCDMIRTQDVRLPDSVFNSCVDHYARREIYQSERLGYSVIAMTWGPGQGTPIHDHSGLWCVEGVWQGALEITQYELTDQRDGKFRFTPVGSIQAGTGSAGSLIPPHEYHTIRNPSPDQVAVSLHIYKAQMSCCSVFQPVGQDWYERGTRKLGLD